MSIAVTEDGRALAEVVRAWAQSTVTPEVRRATIDAGHDELPTFWKALADQGFLAVHLPEAVGGGEAGISELAVVVEELGRALAPGPAVPTMLAAAVLREAGRDDLLSGFADGSRVAAMGLSAGDLTLVESGEGAVLTGTSGWIIGGHNADLFVVPARSQKGPRWVVVERDRASVEDAESHDVTRRMSRVSASELALPEDAQLPLDAQRPRDLAAIVFAAEASGIADWAVATASEYARVREQFGRPIGQFQGVKHRCARMLADAEKARACAWDAAAVEDLADVPSDEASLAAAIAGAVAPEVAVATAKDCIQTLGGIGFTWEHDAHLYLRRAMNVRMALGPTEHWQQRVAALSLEGVRRQPRVELPESAAAIRGQVRAELQAIAEVDGEQHERALADAGFTAPHLSSPWGRGADAVEQLVIAEELRAAELQPYDMVIGNWVVPTLIEGGTDEQKQRFLPASLRGDIVWCQLFSEPGAGSDLAALSTKATKVDGGWVLDGQKVWTSMAREADFGVVIARTNADAPKHKGISYFILDMSTDGIDARPIREITGEALFNEVFLDGVFVPDDMLVGQIDDGWLLARTTLANERVSLSGDSTVGRSGEALLEIAGVAELDDHQRAALGALLSDAHAGAVLSLRTTLRSLSGGQPGPESSVAKLIGTKHAQQAWETTMRWQGLDALVGEHGRWSPTRMYLNSQCLTIAGGTTDVLLNIIGERILGLPRDP